MKNVTIFSTSTCHFCKEAKEFFKTNNIAFSDYNVGTDAEKRKEMLEKSGQLGVPVILVGEPGGKEEVIVGFDEPRLRELLLAR